MERTQLTGNVGKDPKLVYLPSGTAVCNFTVGSNTTWNDRETGEKKTKTNWYNVSVFGRLAEVANQYVKKGMKLYLEGTVTARAYTNAEGVAQASLDLKCSLFELPGKNAGADGESHEAEEIEDAIPF